MPWLLGLIGLFAALILWRARVRAQQATRAEFIRSYSLPPGLYERLRRHHPQLSLKDCQLIGQGLRQFFLAYLKGGRRFVAMPSQGVDDLWHEFILYTKNYDQFCRQAFGRFLHHTPAVALDSGQQNGEGLRRVWWFACREENIDPKKPTRLPLLFAIDGKLAIAGGFVYSLDCDQLRRQGADGQNVHCGADLGCGGGDSGSGGSSSGDGGADSSSDGGSSCGGGCGGGD